ncbi:lamin tail domain-containing protein [Nonomuraea dietziae]|uniref:lamin tail domain-containing protein n=1 Tax=Nonomuraea dietziae TaxID=65515 RepID=UPI003425A0C0
MRSLPLVTSALAVAAVLVPSLPAQAAPAIQITRVYYDSPGSDRRSNTSLNGEYVTITNNTSRAIDLEGWALKDKTGYTYTFGPDVILGARKKITVRSGQGSDGTSTVYWGRRAYVWNNDRDAAYIRRADGKLIDYCSYHSTRYDYKNC